MSDQRYMPPKASIEVVASTASRPISQTEPKEIGGWLILVAIGLIVTPFRVVNTLMTDHWPIFRDGHWELLTDESSAAYHALWAPLITFEIAGNIVVIALAVITLVFFFRKSARTPRFAIGWYAFGAIFLLVDQLLGNLIPAIANDPSSSNAAEMIRSAAVAAIWIPYFLLSERVKSTFIR